VPLHLAKLVLLFLGQLVLDANGHADMQAFDFAFGVEHLIELRKGQLLVDCIHFHRFTQRFDGVLQLPLQIIKLGRSPLNLLAHECLLLVGKCQLALMLHHQLGRKHRLAERVLRRSRRTLTLLRPRPVLRFHSLARLGLLRRHDDHAKEDDRDDDSEYWSNSLVH